MESFPDWLLKELRARNMSQSDLARLAGLGSGTISNIMSGNRNVGQETLTKIANVLHLDPETVFEAAGLFKRDPSKKLSTRAEQLMNLAKNADDDSLDLAITMLEAALKQKEKRDLKTAKS